jgi:hypothetical protein
MNFLHSSTVIGQFAQVRPLTEATVSPIALFNETQSTVRRTRRISIRRVVQSKDMILNAAVAANLRNGWANGRSRIGLSRAWAEKVGIDTRLSYLISITGSGEGKAIAVAEFCGDIEGSILLKLEMREYKGTWFVIVSGRKWWGYGGLNSMRRESNTFTETRKNVLQRSLLCVMK